MLAGVDGCGYGAELGSGGEVLGKRPCGAIACYRVCAPTIPICLPLRIPDPRGGEI